MAGTQLTQNANETQNPMKDHWEIEYSRFFIFPSLPSTSLSLVPLPRSKKISSRGMWLSSSSTASLGLITGPKAQKVLLIFPFQGNIKWEEHYISELHFSWPQVSCLAECPIRGSRVIFASYRDSVGQVQKFAMRFPASQDAQIFISSLKESLKNMRNVGLPYSDFGSENLSPSELLNLKDVNFGLPCRDLGSQISSASMFVSSDGIQNRTDEELNSENPFGNYDPPMQPPLNYEATRYTCSEETICASDLEATCVTLPPSFTAFLSDSCGEAAQEPPKVPGEVDLKSQMARYMADSSSFNDMLSTIERVINELGGDMTLRW